MKTWKDLKWWESREHRDVHRRLEGQKYQPHLIYRAFDETPFDNVKVVILGQDPYPTPGMATGLAFAVPKEAPRLPPTLVNIFKEYTKDVHAPWPKSGDLTPWAEQGVLLLNTCLTVQPYQPGSHRDIGWRPLIQEVLSALESQRKGLVFVLWGKDAQTYLPIVLPSIEARRHSILLSSHPSPLSARRGFFGSRPFTTANAKLVSFGISPVNWRLP